MSQFSVHGVHVLRLCGGRNERGHNELWQRPGAHNGSDPVPPHVIQIVNDLLTLVVCPTHGITPVFPEQFRRVLFEDLVAHNISPRHGGNIGPVAPSGLGIPCTSSSLIP